jgi:hypothetical protein
LSIRLADGGIVDSTNNNYIDLYLAAQKELWNSEHGKIRVRSYPVEVFFQDVNDVLVASGQYSLLHDKWLCRRKDMKVGSVMNVQMKNETNKYQKIVDGLIDTNASAEEFDRYREKFRDLRKTGLASPEGEQSLGNGIFRELRHRGVFDRMNKFLKKRTDQSLSVEAVNYKNRINDAFRDSLLLKIEQLLVEELSKHYLQPVDPVSVRDASFEEDYF